MKKLLHPAIIGSFAVAFVCCKSPSSTNAAKNSDPKADSSLQSSDTSGVVSQPIVEKYWKLVELYGDPVVVDSTFRKEPHIIFKAQDNRMIGSGGCNNITGSYELGENGRIAIPQPIATRMACPNMEVENKFLQALQVADNYIVNGDTLVLNKARMAPLARFKVVYLQ